MAEYKKYYLAFLDVLGFKNLINRNDCEYIRNIFDSFKKSKVIVRDENGITFDNDNIHLKIMSDSIILYVEADIHYACTALLAHCATLQADFLSNEVPILIRGGISYGDFYIEEKNDILFGTALTNAYLLEEKSAKYPRIIAKKNDLHISENDFKFAVFKDDDAFYSVNVYAVLSSMEKEKQVDISRIYAEIDKHLDSTSDSSIREKYLYLEKKMKQFNLGESFV